MNEYFINIPSSSKGVVAKTRQGEPLKIMKVAWNENEEKVYSTLYAAVMQKFVIILNANTLSTDLMLLKLYNLI